MQARSEKSTEVAAPNMKSFLDIITLQLCGIPQMVE